MKYVLDILNENLKALDEEIKNLNDLRAELEGANASSIVLYELELAVSNLYLAHAEMEGAIKCLTTP